MMCPKCGDYLRETEYERVLIHTCDSCGSEVIGPDALQHVVETREERFSGQLHNELAEHKPLFGVPAHEANRGLRCPACDGDMNPVNYGGDSGIVIDRCAQCSTMFLDHDELEKIQLIMERWQDEAPAQIQAIAADLERVRRETAEATGRAFSGSRFAFVNAVINRFLDAA